MDNKKKKIIVAVIAAVVAVGTAITVFAYLQSTAERSNRFTIGEGGEAVTEAFSEPAEMSMKDTVEKIVQIENTGTSDEFVRVYLDFSDSRIRDKAKVNYVKNGLSKSGTWTEFLADLPQDWAFVPESDTDGAVLGGYFYYTKILAPGDKTPALINGVSTDFTDSENDNNVDKISDFDIIVYSESVQTTEIDADGRVYDQTGEWREAWKSFLSN